MKTCRKGRAGERRKERGTKISPFLPFSLFTKRSAQRAYTHIWLSVLTLIALPACGYYSFTGATIPSNLDTIAIPLVQDNSLSPLTALDEEMTQRLIDRFVQQTRLSLETSEAEADAVLTATLDRYTNVPTSVTGEERAQRNRVTITVSVRYVDQVEDEELLQRTFSSFEDYDPVVDGLDGERVAALAALENIADDIFTAATSNW